MNQQLLRIDFEDTDYIGVHLEDEFMERIAAIEDLDGVIVSDYAKGSVTEKLLDELIKYCSERKMILLVDPKPKHKHWYNGADFITPNKNEAQLMSGVHIESEKDFQQAALNMSAELECNVILTAGSKGMYVADKDQEIKVKHIPTVAREVYDVSGAGDTVAAALTLAICSGSDLTTAADIANHAAGIKVGKLGTAAVTLKELEATLSISDQ